jgi:hypothetical protein
VIVVGETFGRVRALENELGKRRQKAGPATTGRLPRACPPVPEAGDILRVVADEKAARGLVETRQAELAAKGGEGSGRATLEDLYRQIQAGQAKELRIILKADVSGSLGAIRHSLEQLATDEVKLNILHEGAGEISDNDIMLAAASNAIVVGFNTTLGETARRAAEAEKVDVRLYDIIYQLTDDIEKALSGLLEPEIVEVIEGPRRGSPDHQGRQDQVIAGSYVTDGRIVRRRRPVWRSGKVDRDRPDRIAAAVPRRRPRGPDGLRVRHRPRRVQRHRRGRHHRVLHATNREQSRVSEVAAQDDHACVVACGARSRTFGCARSAPRRAFDCSPALARPTQANVTKRTLRIDELCARRSARS